MACSHCGSDAVRADRSLAGRLVCGRCGRPLQGSGLRKAQRSRRSGRSGRGRWLLLLLLLTATAVVIGQRRAAEQSPLPCWLDGGIGWIDRLDAALDGRDLRSDPQGAAGAGRCAPPSDQPQVLGPGANPGN